VSTVLRSDRDFSWYLHVHIVDSKVPHGRSVLWFHLVSPPVPRYAYSSISLAGIAASKIHRGSSERNSERTRISEANIERNRQRDMEPRDPTGRIMAAVHVSAGTLRSRVPLSVPFLAHRMASPHRISAIRLRKPRFSTRWVVRERQNRKPETRG